MNATIIKEEPIFELMGCCPEFDQFIKLYRKDLENANVGDSWHCEDQDCYPNRTRDWIDSVTVVYKDENGVCLRVDEDGDISICWIELAK